MLRMCQGGEGLADRSSVGLFNLAHTIFTAPTQGVRAQAAHPVPRSRGPGLLLESLR